MKIDVYDTYAKDKDGKTVHFDVFVEEGTSKDKAYKYALAFLKSLSIDGGYTLEQSRCNFCHTHAASQTVQEIVEKSGHYILKMEGCPK